MSAFWWGFWLVIVGSVVGYLCRAAMNDLRDRIVPGDDRWREFWRDQDR